MKLHGVIFTEKLVPFERELLDKEFNVNIFGSEAVLATPVSPFTDEHEAVEFSPTDLLKPKIATEEFSDVNWGLIGNWPIGKGSFAKFFIQFKTSDDKVMDNATEKRMETKCCNSFRSNCFTR
ncbi:hypothetical protein [Flavihumibacter solisilvae]|uniref:Uncharacterized protein n=1 Tax=Flavihumibacter solisilvae TaxID=1349421 RepID=A0A0C1IMP0_9BACT|nr:hypothetical protein [Flavihumibacter solisilvae]KIC95495.1 hypothetical protein OI18_06355 [Flavihumibacter solisilvae]